MCGYNCGNNVCTGCDYTSNVSQSYNTISSSYNIMSAYRGDSE